MTNRRRAFLSSMDALEGRSDALENRSITIKPDHPWRAPLYPP